MSPFSSWLRRLSHQRTGRVRTGKRRARRRMMVEALESRLVPADLSSIPYVQNVDPNDIGLPTTLGINFNGENFYSEGGLLGIGSQSINVGAYSSGSAAQTDQNIQDILFRVSEIYAPFNVEVTRVTSPNTYFDGSDRQGPSTIFVGPSQGDINVGAGSTPDEFSDYPHGGQTDHLRNSDSYDLAFVDPAGNLGSVTGIATAIAHEAGHTF